MTNLKAHTQFILRCLLLLVPVLLAPVGCSSDPVPSGCATSSECATGRICSDKACIACVESAACVADEIYSEQGLTQCREGLCTACAPGEVGCGCLEDDSCTAGECVADVCTDCRRGDPGCVCRLNGTCAEGSLCGSDGLCAACTPGEEGCACAEGQCDAGLTCSDSVCVPDSCTAGAVDCPCAAGDMCDNGLYCDGSTVCRTCSPDVPGCPCTVDGACEGDNFCGAESLCEACPAVDKPVACGCTASAQCGENLVCDMTELSCREPISCAQQGCLPNQLCEPSTDGDFAGDFVCVPETCVPGYVWDAVSGGCVATDDSCLDESGEPTRIGQACITQNKACVESTNGPTCVDTCQTLGCSLARRDCTPGAAIDLDAVCGTCQPGYVDNNGTCELQPAGTCSGMTAGNISAACAARSRACVEVPGGGAFCGDCLGGRAVNPRTAQCEEVTACGDSVCFGGEFCHYPQNGATPQCRQRCPSGQAINENGVCVACGAVTCGSGQVHGALVEGQCVCEEDTFCADVFEGTGSRCRTTQCAPGEAAPFDGGACTACNVTCGNDPGEGTRVWPWRDPFGQCFCETLDDYYRPLGINALPAICDADGDGWISESAELVYDAAKLGVGGMSDEATLANFRCARRTVDRVQLVNEYGQSRYVGLCGDAIVDWDPAASVTAACPTGITTVALFENDDLDQDSVLGLNDTSYPALGMRKLFAADLNATTKACVSLEGDFNANGIEDLIEAQPRERADMPGVVVSDEDVLFGAVAHFVELHTSRYVAPGAGSGPGRYLVEERSRCDQSFPLSYQVGRDSYWTACTRRRRADYVAADARLASDFGQFGCASDSGTCPLQAPVTTGSSLDADAVVDHDLCALRAAGMLPLANEPWLGMNHHSQFQCGRIAAGTSRERVSPDALSGVSASPEFDFNVCGAVTCAGQAGCVESNKQSDVTNQPDVPNIDCTYGSGAQVAADTIGFVSKLFSTPGSAYDRGCIDESVDTIATVVTATSAEIGRGFSRLCSGFAANPTGVLTAPNQGDFGKLICACGDNYVGPNCEQACPTRSGTGFAKLHTGGNVSNLSPTQRAEYACSPSGYCSLSPPDQATGFTGGRRGFWMCGEPTASRGDPAGLSATGTFNGQSGTVTVQGFVPAVPVIRVPMETPTTNCSGGGCFVDAAGNVRTVTVF